jgi:hypothetical protein
MIHTKGQQVNFNDIVIDEHYIIEYNEEGKSLFVHVIALENTMIVYRLIEMKSGNEPWTPFSASVPYCPRAQIEAATLEDESLGVKMFTVTDPPRRRRRRPSPD